MKSHEKLPPSSKPNETTDSLSYEEALTQLEQIINTLELGEQTLDQSLELFERGQALATRCGVLLEAAELKVKQVAGDVVIPFEDEESE